VSKKDFKSPADEFLSAKPQEKETLDNSVSNKSSHSNSVRTVADILDNIKDDRADGATRSFYLSNKTFNALAKKAKAKNMSNSKFLESILSQLFFEH